MATLDELSDAEILALIGEEEADDLTEDLEDRADGVETFNDETADRLWAALATMRRDVHIYGPSKVHTEFYQAYSDLALGMSAILRKVASEEEGLERYGDLKRLLNIAASSDPTRYATLNSDLGTEPA